MVYVAFSVLGFRNFLIVDMPQWIQKPKNTSAVPGSTVTLLCQVSGHFPFIYEWSFHTVYDYSKVIIRSNNYGTLIIKVLLSHIYPIISESIDLEGKHCTNGKLSICNRVVILQRHIKWKMCSIKSLCQADQFVPITCIK